MDVQRHTLTRRRLLYLGAATATLSTLRVAPAAAAPLPGDAERAVAAYTALLRYFSAADGITSYHEVNPQTGAPADVVAAAVPSGLANTDPATTGHKAPPRRTDANIGLYRGTAPPTDTPYAYLWPFSRALAATLDLYQLGYAPLGDVQERYRLGLPRYRDDRSSPLGYASYPPPPYGQGGDLFYDDNAWIGLDLVRAYRLTGDADALAQAQAAFAFVASGWDANPADPFPGGVFWKQQSAAETNHDRNTVSTAPGAMLALRLYQLTGQRIYLDWGRRLHGWVDTALRDPTDGLYFDHLRPDGTIDTTKWSYNQGAMIGSGVLLYQAAQQQGDASAASGYLAQARATADAALRYYGRVGYLGEDPAFNAIFWRNLLFLASVDATLLTATRQAMRAYADAAWGSNRREDNLFYFPASAPTATLVDQAALVEIHACLTWPDTAYNFLIA